MKTCFSFITMIFVLTVSAWGQNTSITSSDPKELEREIEMMSGFLRYTLSSHFLDFGNETQSGDSTTQNRFFRQGDSVTNGSSWVDTSLRDRFHLKEQGVVFIIPVSALRSSPQFPQSDGIGIAITGNKEGVLKLAFLSTISDGKELTFYRDDRATSQVPEGSESIIEDIVKAFTDSSLIENGKFLNPDNGSELLTRLQVRFNNAAAAEQPFLQALDSVRTPLVDTLAQYGDSMYAVKPDEYINLVFQKSPAYAPSLLLSAPGSVYGTEIISVRKSWITDYKAGKMTLEEFRKKVLQ